MRTRSHVALLARTCSRPRNIASGRAPGKVVFSEGQSQAETRCEVYLSQLESGSVAEPSPHILHKLAEYYGLSYAQLMAAAGYAVPVQEGRPASNDLMFMGDKLSAEEGAAVAAFIQMFRDRSPGKK